MTVSAADWQNEIVAEVGDSDDGVIATYVATIWALYADKAAIAPRLQYLYAKRAACDTVMGAIRKNVDFTTPTLGVKLSQETERLQAMYDRVQAEIVVIESRARANRPAAGGVLVATAPEAPPSWWHGPDGNNPRYRGDVYRPGFRRVIR